MYKNILKVWDLKGTTSSLYMNSPYNLYKTNEDEFINKVCAICLNAMFYPENDDKMTKCVRFQCMHMFHTNCVNQLLQTTHRSCPECRDQIQKITDMNGSIELAIRNNAFDHGDISEELQARFKTSCLTIEDYPYHKIVFERWRQLKERSIRQSFK